MQRVGVCGVRIGDVVCIDGLRIQPCGSGDGMRGGCRAGVQSRNRSNLYDQFL
jgi:hypothetical protein